MKDHIDLLVEAQQIHETWLTKNGGYARDMTMRDHFAGLAMQVLKEDVWNFDLLCKNAYELADAMLKAREAK